MDACLLRRGGMAAACGAPGPRWRWAPEDEARVSVLSFTRFDEAAALTVVPDEYKVGWAGPHAKWRVTRLSDGEAMMDGLEDKAAAQRWIVDRQKVEDI